MFAVKLNAWLAVCVAIAFGSICEAASASAGSSVATAPAVSLGIQEFGNTATDNPGDGFCSFGSGGDPSANGRSFWLLSATTGDRFTVDFESTTPPALTQLWEGAPGVRVYPVGTTDFNIDAANIVAESHTQDNGKGQLVFTAPRTGIMPLRFSNCSDNDASGAYDFVASVLHRAILGVKTATDARRHRTKVAVSLHTPDGDLINPGGFTLLCATQQGRTFRTVAKVVPATECTVEWQKAQRGKRQIVRLTVTGPGYLRANISVRVQAK
ncbi:MAG: hypothetical protein M3065_06735 [Actinomycetota bacterium]|nr:hypothetical protein [Actinomycetota bacterium]